MGRYIERFTEDDLGVVAAGVLENVRNYLNQTKSEERSETLKRLVDFRNIDASEAWRAINRLKFTDANRASVRRLVELLTWLDADMNNWNWADKKTSANQLMAVKNIGRSARNLMSQIVTAHPGNVSSFLNEWTNEKLEGIPLAEFTENPEPKTPNLRAQAAWYHQRKMVSLGEFKSSILLILLADLSRAAVRHKVPVSIASRKRNAKVYFVTRLHFKILQIFGQSKHALNARLTNLAFKSKMSTNDVKGIIKRAKIRGKIHARKSTK